MRRYCDEYPHKSIKRAPPVRWGSVIVSRYILEVTIHPQAGNISLVDADGLQGFCKVIGLFKAHIDKRCNVLRHGFGVEDIAVDEVSNKVKLQHLRVAVHNTGNIHQAAVVQQLVKDCFAVIISHGQQVRGNGSHCQHTFNVVGAGKGDCDVNAVGRNVIDAFGMQVAASNHASVVILPSKFTDDGTLNAVALQKHSRVLFSHGQNTGKVVVKPKPDGGIVAVFIGGGNVSARGNGVEGAYDAVGLCRHNQQFIRGKHKMQTLVGKKGRKISK